MCNIVVHIPSLIYGAVLAIVAVLVYIGITS